MSNKKVIKEMVTCPCCKGKGIDGVLVCDNCEGDGILATGKMWIIEDYIGLNEGDK